MNRAEAWLRGYCRMEVRGVELSGFLNGLAAEEIPFWQVEFPEEFVLRLSIPIHCRERAERICERRMCHVTACREHGARHRYGGLKRRLVLLLLLGAAIAGILRLSAFVWFFRVEGNTTVPAEKILNAVRTAGVDIGTYGPSIDPQRVKDLTLLELPELKWLTVTQSGFRAVIHVRERTIAGEVRDRRRPTDQIAIRGGLVTDVSVLEGIAAVKKGDVVEPGQVLIHGLVRQEQFWRAGRGDGEVYARTWYPISAVTPRICYRKEAAGRKKTHWALRIGRKRINLSQNSSISTGSCDKITVTYQMRLPGDLTLPVMLEKTVLTPCVLREQRLSSVSAAALLQEAVSRRIESGMCAGEIRKRSWSVSREQDLYHLEGTLECREMIARTADADLS